MSRLHMQRNKWDNSHQRLTTEPTTQVIVIPDYSNPASVIDGLIRAVIRLTIKYQEGVHYTRKRGGKDDIERLHLMTIAKGKKDSPAIDAAKELNGELFVNALLVEIFARAGMENLMLDKHKRPYASQLIGKVYNRMFLMQTITPKRIEQLKNIMRTVNDKFITLDDTYFAQWMNSTLIPNYLSRCESTGMPCYKREGLVQMYDMKSTSPIVKFLVAVVQHIFDPNGPGVHYKTAMAHIPDLITIVKKKTTKQEKVDPVTVPAPRSTTVVPEVQKRKEEKEDKELPMANLYLADGMDDDVIIPSMYKGATAVSATLGAAPAIVKEYKATPVNTAKSQARGKDALPPGKDMIDRVMQLLVEKAPYFTVDDVNRIRVWAQKRVDTEIRPKLEAAQAAVEKQNKEIDTLKNTYYA